VRADRPTVVFLPEGAHGPTSNCVGIGDVLRRARVRRPGRGLRFGDEELTAADDRLLADDALNAKLARIAEPLEEPGTVKAAALIEQVALGRAAVTA
jgi:UDP:flavonoid glycosyltransferase YjiC (YdhE family)